MQLFFHQDIQDTTFNLDAEESKHLIKVLRKQQGDRVNFTDGKGCLFECTIIDPNPKKAILKIDQRLYTPDDDYYIHLAISPTKNADRMEWMVEKLTEIGVHEITFMESEYSERSKLKLDRLEKDHCCLQTKSQNQSSKIKSSYSYGRIGPGQGI